LDSTDVDAVRRPQLDAEGVVGDDRANGSAVPAAKIPGGSNTKRLLRGNDVRMVTGLGRSSIYAMIRAKTFPAPVSVGPRAVAWVEDEVQQWITDRIRERDRRTTARTTRAGTAEEPAHPSA